MLSLERVDSRLSLSAVAAHAYEGRTIALLTQHGKEHLIGPVLDEALGCTVERVGGYDTDQLGTFTRDIPRPGTQLDAARRKARIGMELSGRTLGIASEGAFGGDPFSGLMPWNVELIVFIDAERELEIVGRAEGPSQVAQEWIRTDQELEAFARRVGFPGQHLVVRPDFEDDHRLFKGLTEWSQLRDAFHVCLSQASLGKVLVECDLRAHCNPARREMIRKAAQDLALRLSSHCPECRTPGFARTGSVPGLLCEQCDAPTREPIAELWSCLRCDHREQRPRAGRLRASAARCDECNP